MALDPAGWPDSVQTRILWISAAGILIAFWLLARSPLWFLPLALWPVVVGGLVWRYDGLPWTDIASWTLPAAFWVTVIMVTIPLPVSAVLGTVPVAAWLFGFMFWTRVTNWWYARVLRKPYPSLPPRSRG